MFHVEHNCSVKQGNTKYKTNKIINYPVYVPVF